MLRTFSVHVVGPMTLPTSSTYAIPFINCAVQVHAFRCGR